MYGFIAKIRTVPDRREEALRILTNGAVALPGCLAYIVAKDRADHDIIWVTEAWDTEASHKAALALPVVRQAIADCKPYIVGIESQIAIDPVGAFAGDLTE